MSLKFILSFSVMLCSLPAFAAQHDLKITTSAGASGFHSAPSATLLGLSLGYAPWNHWFTLGGAFEYTQSIKSSENSGSYVRFMPEFSIQHGYPWILSASIGAGLQYQNQYSRLNSVTTTTLDNQNRFDFVFRPKISIEYRLSSQFSVGLSASSVIPVRTPVLPEYNASFMFCFYRLMHQGG